LTTQELEETDRWHVLFDELCSRAGFHDAASLASRYCETSGGGGQKEHDAALRNLNNWRSGRHIPRLRSLKKLETILELDRSPELLQRWRTLYRQANEDDDDNQAVPPGGRPEEAEGAIAHGWRDKLTGSSLAAGGILLFATGVMVGYIGASGWRPWGGPADNAPMVPYRPDIVMSVGESRVIHSERGDCGQMPRDWTDVADALPSTALGTFSDGGLARRNSKFCKGITPARAIVFTASQAGVEEFLIQGDFMKVTVVEEGSESRQQ
jgi:hypothetical protein